VPASGDTEDDCGEADGMQIGRSNRSSRRKPALAPLYSSQNPKRLDPGLNPGRRGGKPATSRLMFGAVKPATNLQSYGATQVVVYSYCCRRRRQMAGQYRIGLHEVLSSSSRWRNNRKGGGGTRIDSAKCDNMGLGK
jgi:hypothetical protein